MKNILLDRRFLSIVVFPSLLWILLCTVYISAFVGWDNLSYFPSYESIAIVISTLTPVLLFAILFVVYIKGVDYEDTVSGQMHIQGARIEELSASIDKIVDAVRESREISVDAIESHNVGIDSLAEKLTLLIHNEAERAEKTNIGYVSQQIAFMGLINLVINDINVSATRLLVCLMEQEERPKDEIREFIHGLVNAFSVGDKDVFFCILRHQLADDPERMNSLKVIAGKSSAVANDISRILRELQVIASLTQRFDEGDIIRTLFDDKALNELNYILQPHFNIDGTARGLVADEETNEEDVEEEEEEEEV